MKKILFILAVLASLLSVSAFAVKVSSLYRAEIPVASQDDAVRLAAQQQGLEQILIKLTGNADIQKNPTIESKLKHSEVFVEEFSYAAGTAEMPYVLQIKYEPEDVNQLLRSADITYWGENRPLILVWLAVATNEQSTDIVGKATHAGLVATMKQLGKQAGLPLVFPVMDVADISQVSPSDVTSMAVPALKEAGARYSADALLIGSVQTGQHGYQAKWQLVLGNKQWRWDTDADTIEGVMVKALSQANQTLTKHYTVQTVDADSLQLKLEVAKITQRDELKQLQQYLKQLSLVEAIQLTQVSGDNVELAVQVNGTMEAFKQNASIDQHLVYKSQDPASHKLVYEWVN